jgi:hypothetical protein
VVRSLQVLEVFFDDGLGEAVRLERHTIRLLRQPGDRIMQDAQIGGDGFRIVLVKRGHKGLKDIYVILTKGIAETRSLNARLLDHPELVTSARN